MCGGLRATGTDDRDAHVTQMSGSKCPNLSQGGKRVADDMPIGIERKPLKLKNLDTFDRECHVQIGQLARHSTITLTMDRYSHTVLR